MGLRLKGGLHPDVLREYGFKTGKEWAEAGERCMDDKGYEYMHDWYHKFVMDPEDSSRILYTEEDYDEVAAWMWFKPVEIGEKVYWMLGFECEEEPDMAVDTAYRLAKAGLLKGASYEQCEYKHNYRNKD